VDLADPGFGSQGLGFLVPEFRVPGFQVPGIPPCRKVYVRLPGKENSNSNGARPVHLIITMIKGIRTSRLSIKKSLSPPCCDAGPGAGPAARGCASSSAPSFSSPGLGVRVQEFRVRVQETCFRGDM